MFCLVDRGAGRLPKRTGADLCASNHRYPQSNLHLCPRDPSPDQHHCACRGDGLSPASSDPTPFGQQPLSLSLSLPGRDAADRLSCTLPPIALRVSGSCHAFPHAHISLSCPLDLISQPNLALPISTWRNFSPNRHSILASTDHHTRLSRAGGDHPRPDTNRRRRPHGSSANLHPRRIAQSAPGD